MAWTLVLYRRRVEVPPETFASLIPPALPAPPIYEVMGDHGSPVEPPLASGVHDIFYHSDDMVVAEDLRSAHFCDDMVAAGGQCPLAQVLRNSLVGHRRRSAARRGL